MRKILIGFVSLGIALGIYLLYRRVSETPRIDTDRAAEAIKSAADGNAADLDGEMGKIGDVGVGPVRKARYVTLNERTKEVEREFGFEKLLHEVRDVWEIEKPYMNVYRRNFKCFVTADKGQVQVETVVGRTTPKDATFSSNVIIHIVPTETGGIKESFVYLDDIIFLSEKSLLSTAGPIRFESEDARMSGTGLELIYNEQAERLEYFKIVDLESMSYRVTSSQATLLSSTLTPAEPPAEPNVQAEAQEPPSTSPGPEPVEPNETTVADAIQEEQTPPIQVQPLPESQISNLKSQQEGEYYKCLLNDNVLIDTPDQLIFADERLSIHDIFFSKTLIDQSDEVDTDSTDTTAETSAAAPPPDANEPSSETTGAEPNVPASFIVITCDGGLLIVPKDSTRALDGSTRADEQKTKDERRETIDEERVVHPVDPAPDRLDDGTERTKFLARTIDYNAVTGDVITGGRSELTYYKAGTTSEANEPPTPMKVAAREGARYSKASNQVVFNDCLCTMPQAGLTEQRDVTFSAPQITVDLPQVRTKQPDILAAGPVALAFYMEDKGQPTTDEKTTDDGRSDPRPSSLRPLTPVTVHARKRAHYSASLNQMAFEGDCRCMMLREDPNVLEEYMLLSERMTIDLAEDANNRTPGPAAGVEHLTATGEVVRLATTRVRRPSTERETRDEGRETTDERLIVHRPSSVVPRVDPNNHQTSNRGQGFPEEIPGSGRETLGGVELKCRQFDYDAVQQLYWATGPGVIKLNNAIPAGPPSTSSGPEPADGNEPRLEEISESPGPFSLREPCWAIVGGFNTLRYSLLENRILADAAPQENLWITYAPMIGDGRGDVTATASHVEAMLRETPDAQMELATLNATGGILYEDDRNHQFLGSELFYDHTTGIVKVKGDPIQPCFYNGILVDQIQYDVNADKVEFNVVGPGTIQLGQ